MNLVRAFLRRSPSDRRLLLEATVMLAGAAVAIRSSAFPRVMAFGAVPLGRRTALPRDQVIRAVVAAARRMPFRAACFEQGLAAQRMLRRRGLDARLHYGIAPGSDLSAHVWVSVERETIIGGGQEDRFVEVGQWP